MRDLSTQIELELGYDSAISERPQDGDQLISEQEWQLNERYDLQEASFSLREPIKTEEYSLWISDFINDELNYFTDSEVVILSALFASHYNWVYMMHDLNKSYWASTVDSIQDCFNQ